MSMVGHISDTIKAVFFDHDDTLFGSIEPIWTLHKHVAKKYYNKQLTDEELKMHWGKPLEELLCLLYGTDDVDIAFARVFAEHEKYPKLLFTDTKATLENVKNAGKLLGIITAANRLSFEHDLRLHSINKDLLDYTQTSDETQFHKPDPKVFEPAIAWLKAHRVMPHEVLYIGDGLHDMKAALGANFSFLGVETGLVTAAEFKKAKAQSIPHIGHLLI